MLPLIYLGEGQFQAPRGFAKRADRELVIGETLQWEIIKDRSMNSHRHYFALIAEAWANLPEQLAEDFPSPEKLRKWALIKAGYCTMTRIACRDNAAAVAACALLSGIDSFSICDISGSVVTVYRATSQSVRAMGAKEFQISKEKVLMQISQIIGADVTQASEAA